jgi:hypothetical protein
MIYTGSRRTATEEWADTDPYQIRIYRMTRSTSDSTSEWQARWLPTLRPSISTSASQDTCERLHSEAESGNTVCPCVEDRLQQGHWLLPSREFTFEGASKKSWNFRRTTTMSAFQTARVDPHQSTPVTTTGDPRPQDRTLLRYGACEVSRGTKARDRSATCFASRGSD